MHGGEAVFNYSTQAGQFELFGGGKILRRELGVGHHHSLQAKLFRGCNKRQNFAAPQVTSGQNHVVFRDEIQTGFGRRRELAGAVDDSDRRGRNTRCRQFELNFGPKRKVFLRPVGPARGFVSSIYRGHPYDLASRAPGQFHRNRVQPANAVIQSNCAKSADARHSFRDDLGPLRRRKIVGFQNKALQSVLKKFGREVEIVDAAFDDIRSDVYLKVITSLNRTPCLIGGRLVGRDRGCC